MNSNPHRADGRIRAAANKFSTDLKQRRASVGLFDGGLVGPVIECSLRVRLMRHITVK